MHPQPQSERGINRSSPNLYLWRKEESLDFDFDLEEKIVRTVVLFFVIYKKKEEEKNNYMIRWLGRSLCLSLRKQNKENANTYVVYVSQIEFCLKRRKK